MVNEADALELCRLACARYNGHGLRLETRLERQIVRRSMMELLCQLSVSSLSSPFSSEEFDIVRRRASASSQTNCASRNALASTLRACRTMSNEALPAATPRRSAADDDCSESC